MHTVISISFISVCLVICLTGGIVMWRKRKEVGDRSRLFLAVFNLLVAVLCILRLSTYVAHPNLQVYHAVLAPFLLIGSLASIILYLLYPIEVVNPGWLNWRRGLLLAAPELLVIVLMLCGLRFQPLVSLSDIWTHILDFDVLVRLGIASFAFAYTFLLFWIPYNWRKSSADNRWIWRTNLITMVMGLLFFVQVFTTLPLGHHIHLLWICFAMVYYTCFEVFNRLGPANLPSPNRLTSPQPETRKTSDLWTDICRVMDIEEAWRNPNTTVETLSKQLGTNRIYVARSIREHTDMSFNDYMNNKRVEFIASLLRQNPSQNFKELFFAAGFRSRDTAWRNFVKFKGCSPSDYTTSL